MAGADGFNEDDVEARAIEQAGDVARGTSKTSEGSAGCHRTEVDTGVIVVRHHADAVAQERAAGEGAGGIDGKDGNAFALGAQMAAQLIDALNANFSDRDLKFSRGISGFWYVSCDALALPQTTSIRTALRGAVFEKLPQSRGKLSWKSIQNEAQMLFHSHAINDAREVAGKLTVNGLWFWGEGVLPTPPSGSNAGVDAAFGESALINGLAKWRGSQLASLTTQGHPQEKASTIGRPKPS